MIWHFLLFFSSSSLLCLLCQHADDGGTAAVTEKHPLKAISEEDDAWAYEKVCQLLEVLPKSYDIEKVRKTFQINITPPGLFLMQDLERFNRLVSVVERDLIDLRNVSRRCAQPAE